MTMDLSSSSSTLRVAKMKRLREELEGGKDEEKEIVVKWAKHYSSIQQILLVGEGDFSFSLSLAKAFGSASNIIATSFDSHDTLLRKYDKAKENLENLRNLGAMIFHEVDATKMKSHLELKMRKFDRIVFNFPHAGFNGRDDDMRVINHHRQLVHGFFASAIHMLGPYGEVHVSHKIGDPFNRWNIEALAKNNYLLLKECTNFDIKDYPGYNNKRGAHPRCNDPFPLGECRTFMFHVWGAHTRKKAKKSQPAVEGISSTLNCPSSSSISNFAMNSPDGYVFDEVQTLRRNERIPFRNSSLSYAEEVQHSNREQVLRDISRRDWCRCLIFMHGTEKRAVYQMEDSIFGGRYRI